MQSRSIVDRVLGRNRPPVVPVLRLAGVIGPGGPLRPSLSLARLAGPIERAFAHKSAPAVALAINSPGGSAVQSALIAGRIRALAEEKKKPVLAFVEDVAASGGYWLACAADEIFADASSIVGSIGVVSAGFGFPQLIERAGIERRVHTSGRRKMILDPFQPEREEDVAKLKTLQGDIHEQFKEAVRRRRAGRLKAAEEELFDGEFWSGARGVELGLVDGIGHMREVLRARFGDKVRLAPVATGRGWLRRRLGTTGAGVVDDLLAAVEDRALWQRYGL